MARHINPRKREAERTFPHCVDIRVPPDGLGGRLNEMLTWCRERVVLDAWAEHGHRE
jgi:hypothetical protein